MDANLLKLLSDAGTVAILVWLLVTILKHYANTVNRLTDMLDERNEDESK